MTADSTTLVEVGMAVEAMLLFAGVDVIQFGSTDLKRKVVP
jgi:hypothetical protein